MTKRSLATALVGLAAVFPAAAHAGHAKRQPQPMIHSIDADAPLAPEDRQHLLGDTFTVVKTVGEIPAPVRQVLIPEHQGLLEGMANPGQRFQTTDVLGPVRLPFRRLILAANSAGYSLIYDEHGGYAYYRQLSLYRLTGGRASLVWQAYAHPAAQDFTFEQLRALIRQGDYSSTGQLPVVGKPRSRSAP